MALYNMYINMSLDHYISRRFLLCSHRISAVDIYCHYSRGFNILHMPSKCAHTYIVATLATPKLINWETRLSNSWIDIFI